MGNAVSLELFLGCFQSSLQLTFFSSGRNALSDTRDGSLLVLKIVPRCPVSCRVWLFINSAIIPILQIIIAPIKHLKFHFPSARNVWFTESGSDVSDARGASAARTCIHDVNSGELSMQTLEFLKTGLHIFYSSLLLTHYKPYLSLSS